MVADEKPQVSKRTYGQGSLVEISPGLWRMRIHLGTDVITGRMIQPSRRFRGSRTAAEKALAAFRVEVEERSKTRSGVSPRVTLGALIEQHLAASTSLAPGTRRSYRSAYERHIAPGIGRIPIARLGAQDFRDYYERLAVESGLSDSSIWSIYSLISGAVGRAIKEQDLRFNRNVLVTPHKPQRPEKTLLTDDELIKVFAVAADLGEDWAFLLRVLCATGMRRGEAMALRWSSLGSDNMLAVRSGAVDDVGGVIEKSPKTGNRRRLLIDHTTAMKWRARRADVERTMSEAGLPFGDDLYVFSNDVERRTPRRPDLVSKKWAVIRERAGVDAGVELRSLRNWNITVLREAGFPLEFIGSRVGHEGRGNSPLAMTASYSVSRREQEVAMARAIESRLNAALEPGAGG